MPEAKPLRRSIEVEYWVVDDEGYLAEPTGLVDATEGAEREFVEPLLEVKTTPCETTAELREELLGRLGRVLRRAEELDRGLVPLATPVHTEEIADLPSERTDIQDTVVGGDFEYVRHCAGTHVHIEQLPGREVDQLNTLVALDPALALANSSPFFHGRHIAAGARSKLYRWLAYDDLDGQGRLWPYVDDADEWDARLERRYEKFRRAAIDAGIDVRAVEEHFDPESAVWTPVQFREEFGTVEWRSPDATLPSDVLRLADTIADTVAQLEDTTVRIHGEAGRRTADTIVLPEFDAVQEYVNAAIRDGLQSAAVRSYLERMGFDTDAYDPLTEEIDRLGTLSPASARDIRLEHARRLEADVLQVQSVTDD